ncbi:MAG: hypothetical protein WCF16_03930 [Alphaproteobacteria bacterium]
MSDSRAIPHSFFLLPVVGLMVAAFGAGAAAAAEMVVLDTENSTIRYPAEKEKLARALGEVFESGMKIVADDLGTPQRRVTIYVYATKEDMAEGAVTILGRTPAEARAIARAGMSDRDRDAILVIGSADKWSKDFLRHAVAHEHAHGMTTARFGPALADRVRWTFEGLGEYEGLRALAAHSPASARIYRTARLKSAFKALVMGRLPRLEAIAGRAAWFANINTDIGKWDRQYACAYAAMDYAIRKYGFRKVGAMLTQAGGGVPIGAAMSDVLGVSPLGFEAGFWAWLAAVGFLKLFPLYTAALVAVAASLAAGLLAWRRRRSA